MRIPAVAIVAAVAASSFAAPANQVLLPRTCSIYECEAAYAPLGAACFAAAAKMLRNMLLDFTCLASLGYNIVDAPAVCNGCFNLTMDGSGSMYQSIKDKMSHGLTSLGDGITI